MTHGADSRQATTKGAGKTRARGIASRGVILLTLLAVAACVRTQPPAPVDDRTGAYTRTPVARAPAPSRPTAPATTAPINSAPVNSGPVKSAPVSSGRITSGTITSAPLDPPPSVPPQSTPSTPSPKSSAPYASPSATMVWPPPPPSQPLSPSSSQPSAVPAAHADTSGTADEVTVQVAPGQTLYAIAREHNVPVRALIDINNLDPPYALRSGQRIKVPMLPTHTVGEGETLTTLARSYGVGVRALAETNHLEPPYRIVPGTQLLIPRAAVEGSVASADHALHPPPGMEGAPSAPAANPNHVLRPPPNVAPSQRSAPVEPLPETQTATLTPPPLPPPSTRNLPSSRGFLWPIHGTIASPFGPKPGGTQNDGVNIVAKRGTAVHAAEDGVVVYAGNELRGYGNLLLIRHVGGWTTAYAHNDELLVSRGAHVKRGQVISKVGGTGGVSSPQLHFELRQSGRPVDPVAVMGPLT